MSNNYDDYGYEDSNNDNSGLGRKILIIALVLIAIFLIVFLLKSCNKSNKPSNNAFDYESALLDAGKSFYEYNQDLFPSEIGECAQVELETLISRGIVSADKFKTCNTTTTYVKVCKLENGSMHYTPWLTCTDKSSESEYGEFKEGNIADVIANESLIKFEFLPQALKTTGSTLGKVEELWKSDIKYGAYKTLGTSTHYRYKDLLYIWNVQIKKYYTSKGEKSSAKEVNEYYTTAPTNDHVLHDSSATAYKWFTSESTKVYYMKNGAKAFSATPVEGYPYNEGGTIVTMYQTRNITGTYSPSLYHECRPTKNSTAVKYQKEECGKGTDKNFSVETNKFYSCASTASDSVAGNKVSSNTTCNKYSNWSSATQTACDTSNKELCRSASATFYNWYKLEGDGNKKYYPSGSASASKEKIYYTSAPVAGAIRDESTKTKAYKWYKATDGTSSGYSAVAPSEGATKTNTSKWSNWSSWTTKNPKINDGRTRKIESKQKIKLQQILGTTEDSWEDLSDKFVSEDEMINIFKSKNYDVNSLKDINNNGELRYKVKMYIRNKKANK